MTERLKQTMQGHEAISTPSLGSPVSGSNALRMFVSLWAASWKGTLAPRRVATRAVVPLALREAAVTTCQRVTASPMPTRQSPGPQEGGGRGPEGKSLQGVEGLADVDEGGAEGEAEEDLGGHEEDNDGAEPVDPAEQGPCEALDDVAEAVGGEEVDLDSDDAADVRVGHVDGVREREVVGDAPVPVLGGAGGGAGVRGGRGGRRDVEALCCEVPVELRDPGGLEADARVDVGHPDRDGGGKEAPEAVAGRDPDVAEPRGRRGLELSCEALDDRPRLLGNAELRLARVVPQDPEVRCEVPAVRGAGSAEGEDCHGCAVL